MNPGTGWYLIRCGKCHEAFLGTSMVEWCDCGNRNWHDCGKYPVDWLRYKNKRRKDSRLKIEMEFTDHANGCLIVWDTKEGDIEEGENMKITQDGLARMFASKCLRGGKDNLLMGRIRALWRRFMAMLKQ